MSIRTSNEQATIKSSGLLSGNAKVGKLEADVNVKSWEFFKNIGGLSTDFLNKPINIPSTAFTPNLTMPSKAYLENVYKAFNLISGIQKKAAKIADVFDGSSNAKSKKEFVKKMIGLSSKGY